MEELTARAFLSHSHKDADVAQRLKAELLAQGVQTWIYEADLPFGSAMSAKIAEQLRLTDYLLVLLSDSARASQWVGRELGLALQLQQEANGTHPYIIGIRLPETSSDSTVLHVLDFNTGEPTGQRHDFSLSRYFNYEVFPDNLAEFAALLRPRVTYITSASEEHQRLLDDSFDCYIRLFPDEEERDEPDDIAEWLAEARLAEERGDPWREVYAVLEVAESVVGMAYMSAHRDRNWCFGNYFGVLREWRGQDRSEVFLKIVSKRLREISAGLRGILFEVEPEDAALLERAKAAPRLADMDERNDVLRSLRTALRIRFYRPIASALVRLDGQPLPYWQPAMKEPLDAENECPLVLMANFITGKAEQCTRRHIEEALDFIYDDLYGDAYGGAGAVAIPDYRRYVAGVKEKVLVGVRSGDCRFGQLNVMKGLVDLRKKARSEGFLEDLDL